MKKRVAILYGGPSGEHDVSVNSAKNIIENIDPDVFEVFEVFITREGRWIMNQKELDSEAAVKALKQNVDIVYPVLHGSFGEDGVLQKLLEREGVVFVGSGSVASKTAIDKNASNVVFEQHGLSIPRSQIISKGDTLTLQFPVIVKPINEGSSIGLYKCDTPEVFQNLHEDIFSNHTQMLAQEFVQGREFTCGVLDVDGKQTALPATEIILKGGLFDYKTKYTAGECSEVTPAEVDDEVMKSIQSAALKCHKILGCKSISRTDFILSDSGVLYVLETNTIPGMTKTSFIPQQAKAFGLSMQELITELVRSAEN